MASSSDSVKAAAILKSPVASGAADSTVSGTADTAAAGGKTYDSLTVGKDATDLKADIKVITNRTDLVDTTFKEYVAEFQKMYPNINISYEGLVPKVQKSMLSKDLDAMQPHIRAFVERAVAFTACPDCGGTRLNEGARASKIAGVSIADACAMQISDLAEWVAALDEPSARPLLMALHSTLEHFVEIFIVLVVLVQNILKITSQIVYGVFLFFNNVLHFL